MPETTIEPLRLGPDAVEITDPTFRTDDPGQLWYVLEGSVDLFMAVEGREDGDSRWRPLISATAGTLIPGLPPAEFAVIARPAPGGKVARFDRTALHRVTDDQCAAAAAAFDAWLEPLLDKLGGETLPPREFTPLESGQSATVTEDEVLRPVGGPLWFEAPGMRLRGRSGSRVLKAGELAPASEGDWLVAEGDATATAISTATLISSGRLWDAFDAIAGQAVRALMVQMAREEEAELARIAERSARDEQLRAESDREFAALMDPATRGHIGRAARDPVMAAMRLVADELGVEVRRPPASAGIGRRVDELSEIVRASGLFSREVSLRGQWWKEDAGPMVGFLEAEDGRPVALLRRMFGYEVHDPVKGESRRVDATVAAELRDTGRSLYPQLPDRPLNGFELMRFGAHGTRRDLIVFLLAAFAVAGLSLLVPIASGQVLGTLVPNGESSLITSVCLALVGVAAVVLLLAAVQNLAALRVESALQTQIQEGLWGRIMRLSPSFFRDYSTGDLATRALALTQVQELLGDLSIKMSVASVTALANITLIMVYDVQLGLVTIGLFALIAIVAIPSGRRSLRLQRQSFDYQREVNSRAFQLVGHVGKLRAAAAEERAFAFWADAFAQGRHATYAARRIQNRFTALAAAFSLLSFAAVFVFAGEVLDVSQSTFFVFTIAFGQALAAVLLIVVTTINSMPVVPLLEGMSPIIRATPETSDALSDPGEISGAIDVSGVTFSYSDDRAPVLDDVSFTVHPGEFVAIVGPSGSGKSTLVRLMLGFEAPQVGAVLYDEQDLGDLDVAAVRRQCGVVMQDSQLFAGDILSNVIGSGVYTADDAWEAIEMVGMAEDIAAMPMGMYTVVSEGAGTLSGGQRQRIALARALVARPRIIFLDEATSALDNITQQQVIESMRKMKATRVVVAHRLSTIRDADRIVVMRDGRIVETGDYDELMAADGPFRRLAERQLA